MALTYKARRRLALLILVVGIPVYIVACVVVVGLFERPSMWLELAVYGGLGILWAFPLRSVFRGIGQADPDAPRDDT